MTEPSHLKPRTVAIIFGVVAIAFLVLCIVVGAWPLAVGGLIAILMLPLFFLVFKVGTVTAVGLVFILAYAVTRPLPRRFRAFASERDLPPAVVVLIFAAFVGILMLIFRSVAGVLASLCVAGIFVGLPYFAEWLRQRRLKKSADNVSELSSRVRAHASRGGSLK